MPRQNKHWFWYSDRPYLHSGEISDSHFRALGYLMTGLAGAINAGGFFAVNSFTSRIVAHRQRVIRAPMVFGTAGYGGRGGVRTRFGTCQLADFVGKAAEVPQQLRYVDVAGSAVSAIFWPARLRPGERLVAGASDRVVAVVHHGHAQHRADRAFRQRHPFHPHDRCRHRFGHRIVENAVLSA